MIRKILTFFALLFPATVWAQKRPNVLFIAVDDLNDWIGVMKGHPQAHTPNIDRLAKSGVLFRNAHCQAPICGPSRASIMTGLQPATSGNYLQLNDKDIQKGSAAPSTFLPEYFEQNGYKTMAVGKLFHNGDKAGAFQEYGGVFEKFGPKPAKRFNYNPAWFEDKKGNTQTDWGAFPEKDEQMPDFKSARWATAKLRESHEKPFFLGVGFVRPHVPWYVPQKWFDRFPLDKVIVPPYLKNDQEDVPPFGRRVADVPMMPTTEWMKKEGQWKKAVQAYLACISFVDAQIGKVLDALEESPYADNTIVVLWSDHGYHLGEKNRFAKQALWNLDTKTVLIFKAPRQAKHGATSDKPVQLLDMYPTLVELCGLPENRQNEGHSLVPLLKKPKSKNWNHVAITSYGKGNTAITDERYKLIRYEDGSSELYDHKKDPNEWKNVAQEPDYAQTLKRLEKHIPAQQAELSVYTNFKVNDYFIRKVQERKEAVKGL
ncbi:choline-sulfatase (plasmid) [Fulvitalea axinellae]|uniref:Choline-sulfatase n=1 Tax=Fulvitalea axinellae TaxID=1182444 RepID=A0AAU9CIR7_9BACT|nr:choline-sulfatase [Fulvitalea axinellae]